MNSLLICSSEKELNMLTKYEPENYYIGTINYEFYCWCINNRKKVFFLESNAEIPYIKTWNIISKINDVIKQCKLKKEYLYSVSYHIEGGLPSHIAYILMMIDLFEKIIPQYEIDVLYMVDNKENWKLNEAAFLYVVNRIKYYIKSENGANLDCLYTLQRSYYDSKEHDCILYNEVLEKIRTYEYNYKKNIKVEKKKYEIGCLYPVQNSEKHFMWTISEVNAYNKEFSVNIICFYNSKDTEKMRSLGYHVDCIEDYYDRALFKSDINIYLSGIREIYRKLQDNLYVNYKGVNLKYFLCKKTLNYLQRQHIEYVYVDNCMHNYFSKNEYEIIRAWGNSDFWQTKVAYENTKEHNTKYYKIFGNAVYFPPMYDPDIDEISIRIFPNKYIKDIMLKNVNFHGNVYYLPDIGMQNRYYNREKFIKLKKEDEKNILFAMQEPFLGCCTIQEYFDIGIRIIEILSQNLDVKVFVKNHPNIDENIESEFRKKLHINTVYFIDKNMDINEALEKCAVVISPFFSTVIFDAAIKQRPVFGIIYNHNRQIEKQTDLHKEGFLCYTDIEKMCKETIECINQKDKAYEIVNCQNNYMEKMIGCHYSNANKAVLSILKKEVIESKNII